MMDRIRVLIKDEEGATMVEYALVVAAIAVVALVGAKALGTAVNDKFTSVAGSVAAP